MALITLACVSALFWFLMVVVFLLLTTSRAEQLDPNVIAVSWPTMGWGLAGSAVIGAAMWGWVARSAARPEFGAGVAVAAGALLIFSLTLAGLELRLTGYATDLARAASSLTYALRLDRSRNTLFINGSIGPGFGEAVERDLAKMRDPLTVEISSRGGLLAEALQAAQAIHARPNSTVLIREECASACMLVLMGAGRRLATDGAGLYFHAAAPLVDTKDRMVVWQTSQEGRQADAFLLSRGVPPDVISEANRIGPRLLLRVTPPQAENLGILTGIVVNDPPAGAPSQHDTSP